jgi:hypothetical protein
MEYERRRLRDRLTAVNRATEQQMVAATKTST